MNAALIGREVVDAFAAAQAARFLSLALAGQQPDAAARQMTAARWVDDAAPLIAAYLDVEAAMERAYEVAHDGARQTLVGMYADGLSLLRDEIEAVRDEALSLANVTAHHVHATPEAVEIADAFNDLLSVETVSVEAALRSARKEVARG